MDAKRWVEQAPDHLEYVEAYRVGDRLIECGAARFVGNRTWPAARIYRLKGGRWNRVANQDPGRPVGSARFARLGGRIDPNRIVSVTSRDWHLSSPAGGPIYLSARSTDWMFGLSFQDSPGPPTLTNLTGSTTKSISFKPLRPLTANGNSNCLTRIRPWQEDREDAMECPHPTRT